MAVSYLTPGERSELLARARRAAASALGAPFEGLPPPDPSGKLLEPGMAFVTWKLEGRLRGCIGSIEPVRPLWADVEANAVHALLRDPRFEPVEAPELARLHLEISVLSPFVPVADPLASIVIGTHGLLVETGSRRGLLLPQVPVEWGWNVETFLGQACRKAGLPADVWRERGFATISSFTADVFGESGG